LKIGGVASVPVAENRDVSKYPPKFVTATTARPLQPNHRQDHRRAGGGAIPGAARGGRRAIKAPLAMRATRRRSADIPGYVLILWGSVIEHGFSDRAGSLFARRSGLAACQEGRTGTAVVYADRFTRHDERRRAAEVGESRGHPVLKRFTVFNMEPVRCCEGVRCLGRPAQPPDQIEPRAEALIAATGADFRIGVHALLQHVGDFVQVPPPAAYFEADQLAPDRIS